MILFQNHLIILDYDPGTDVLAVVWPSVSYYDLLEIERTLNTLVNYIRDYDVKRLLIDSRTTTLHPDLDAEKYMQIVTAFAVKLSGTRLEKSARVVHPDQTREVRSEEMSEEIKRNANLKIQNQNFSSVPEAMAWLVA